MRHFKDVILLATLVASLSSHHQCTGTTLPAPHAINFIGIGYDIINGNPEGGQSSGGGVDPGLKVSRNVLKLSYDNGAISSDGMYRIPDETTFMHRSSAITTTSYSSFYGTKSYRDKLFVSVGVTGGYEGSLVNVAFAASAKYQSISQRTSQEGKVFFASSTVENLGRARYRTDLASNDKYYLGREFVAAACDLPSTFDSNTYMQFIENWGTHIVTEVDVGVRSGENYEMERSSFVNFASTEVGGSVSLSGSIGAFSASLAVDMEKFNSQLNAEKKFGELHTQYTIGSQAMTEPIKLTLMAMNEAFDDDYWTRRSEYEADGRCSSSWNLASAKANVLTALQGYAEYLHIQANNIDPLIRVPLTWPTGTYGLPRPISGCPNSQFTWAEGYRKHDTENDWGGNNHWTPNHHIWGIWLKNSIQHHFCMKTHTAEVGSSNLHWPPGSYCIYKSGTCPTGFSEGTVVFDDENTANQNTYAGAMPDGTYTADTFMKFCCREDAPVSQAIYLPTDDNFYLFARFPQCQQVQGMQVTNEYVVWDTEDEGDRVEGMVPYQGLDLGVQNINLHFCYYRAPIAIAWPDGTYGFPKPKTGCPNKQFTWSEGYRYHDTESTNSNNHWSNSLHLHLSGFWAADNVQHEFCMKTNSAEVGSSHSQWPAGSYCIYKLGTCPTGFTYGAVGFDDEDHWNANVAWGAKPDGIYNTNTVLTFCCRQDGPVNQAISLPTDENFFLFPTASSQCQQVSGMQATSEYFSFDTENSGLFLDSIDGMIPYKGKQAGDTAILLYFCYYQRN